MSKFKSGKQRRLKKKSAIGASSRYSDTRRHGGGAEAEKDRGNMTQPIPDSESVWMSQIPPPETQVREAMKFVRVSLVDGYLTDISISMILVELKCRGIKFTRP